MKKIIIAVLCLIAVAGTAVYILTQADTADETIALNDIQVEATVDPETTVDPEETVESEPEAEIEPTPEPEAEVSDRTYTQEEANLFFGIVDGSVENTGTVTEAEIDAFIDWLDTHLEEAEALEQNYIDSLVEADVVVEEAPVVETPAATTPSSSGSSSGAGSTTTPTVTTPTVPETPSTSTDTGSTGNSIFDNAGRTGNLTAEEVQEQYSTDRGYSENWN